MTILIWILGFLVSVALGSLVVKYLNEGLRDYIGIKKEQRNKLTLTVGCIERFIYTLLFYRCEYQILAGLFALMAAQKLLAIQKIDKDKVSDSRLALYKENLERTNVYFISSFTSLFFGILGGIIIKFLK